MMSSSKTILRWFLGLIGAAAGAVLGYYLFKWLLSYGFYALALPGALLGFGFVRLSQWRSTAAAVVCGVGAITLGVFIEWHTSPFVADPSLKFFLSHLDLLSPVTWVMIALGAFFSFWFVYSYRTKTPFESRASGENESANGETLPF